MAGVVAATVPFYRKFGATDAEIWRHVYRCIFTLARLSNVSRRSERMELWIQVGTDAARAEFAKPAPRSLKQSIDDAQDLIRHATTECHASGLSPDGDTFMLGVPSMPDGPPGGGGN